MKISELIKEEQNTVELTTFKGNRIPNDAWTEGVMYKGLNVYNTIYEGRVARLLSDEMENVIERFDGKLEMQESYLGYSPSKDVFISGYDGWATVMGDDGDEEGEYEDDMNCSPYVIFKLSDDGKEIDVKDSGSDMSNTDAMWYAKRGGLEEARRQYKDLIDIRLD